MVRFICQLAPLKTLSLKVSNIPSVKAAVTLLVALLIIPNQPDVSVRIEESIKTNSVILFILDNNSCL